MNMTPKEKLLKRLPKKYHCVVRDFEEDTDLVDDCKYMLYRTDEYTDGECTGSCYPVRSINEAIYFIKKVLYEKRI